MARVSTKPIFGDYNIVQLSSFDYLCTRFIRLTYDLRKRNVNVKCFTNTHKCIVKDIQTTAAYNIK